VNLKWLKAKRSTRRRLDVRLPSVAPALQPQQEVGPAGQGFSRPDPEAGCDPNNECHKVLDHEHLEGRFGINVLRQAPVFVARDRVGVGTALAGSLVPGEHPLVVERLLVEKAAQDDEGRDSVQDREDANPDHKHL